MNTRHTILVNYPIQGTSLLRRGTHRKINSIFSIILGRNAERCVSLRCAIMGSLDGRFLSAHTSSPSTVLDSGIHNSKCYNSGLITSIIGVRLRGSNLGLLKDRGQESTNCTGNPIVDGNAFGRECVHLLDVRLGSEEGRGVSHSFKKCVEVA